MRSVVSKVRLHANSMESTSALRPLSLLVVVVEVLLVDAVDESVVVSPAAVVALPPLGVDESVVVSPGAVVALPPLGGVVCVSASPVEDDGSTVCGDDGVDGRRADGSGSRSPGGQSVDVVVDSGAVLGRSVAAAVTPDRAEVWGGDRRRLSPICDKEPRKSTPAVEEPSSGGSTLGMLESTLVRSRSRLLLNALDASVTETSVNGAANLHRCYCIPG